MAAEPLTGAQLIRLSPSLGHALIDRLLGGAGDVSVEDRPFTDIDVHVLERGLPVFLEALGESWAGVERLHPAIRLLEASPQFLRLVGPQEAIVQIDIEISFSHHSGDLTFVIPYESLKAMLPKLTSVALLTEQTEDRPADLEGARLLRSAALGIEVEMTAVVGGTTLTVAEFLSLGAGDVVLLDRPASEPIELWVEGRPKFVARPFVRSRRLCLVIEDRVAESEGDQSLAE
jgi:flagellar motor switch protein FliM